MGDSFFDMDSDKFAFTVSDNMAMNTDGDFLMRTSDCSAMDLNTGEIHIISSWPDDPADPFDNSLF